MSYMKTAILLGGLTSLFLGVGFLLGGNGGMVIALMIAIGMNVFAYWNSGDMVLRMYGARQVTSQTSPKLYGIVQRLSARASLPMPRVFVVENDQPNAFATGRDPNHAAVAATTGLLRQLNDQEVTAVMAHELAHVKNRDTLIMTVTATIAGAISLLANLAFLFRSDRSVLGAGGTILLMIFAPIAAMVVQMAISRSREYEADRIGAQICGQPKWLASALANLHNRSHRIDNPVAERNPATAHMFIINPLHRRSIEGLFSTHPPIADRIRHLNAMTAQKTGPWG